MIRIGLDPDNKKSGIAVLEKPPFGKTTILNIETMSFFPIIELIKELAKGKTDKEIVVIIEAGWLNKTNNYHAAATKSIAAKIGNNVGQNKETGLKLVEAMEFYNIPYRLYKPTTSKWNADLFKKITGYTKRTNAEERDAVRAAWY